MKKNQKKVKKVKNTKKEKIMNIVFLLDRSGSMSGSESDTIGGYNSFLNEQRKKNINTKITTVLFDDKYELLHNQKSINEVKNLTEKDYYVRGCTALLDAIGITIKNIEKNTDNEKVLFVITTDGLENASHEYTKEQVYNKFGKKIKTEINKLYIEYYSYINKEISLNKLDDLKEEFMEKMYDLIPLANGLYAYYIPSDFTRTVLDLLFNKKGQLITVFAVVFILAYFLAICGFGIYAILILLIVVAYASLK